MEASGLPASAFSLSSTLESYRRIQADLHAGIILPIGQEPSGTSWTGFQSIRKERGYLLVFREINHQPTSSVTTWLPPGKKILLTRIAGSGDNRRVTTGEKGAISFTLPEAGSYVLYQYKIVS
jgi:hypothetical protein